MRWLLLSLALPARIAQSQQLQDTPKVEPKIQTDNTVPPKKNPTEEFDSPVATATNTSNVEPAKHAKNAGDEGTEYWSFCGYRVKITDTLLVVFTAFLFAATAFLYRATRNLVKGAEDTAKKQLRAYVNISSARTYNIADVQRIHFEIKNFGQTHAKEIVLWCDLAVGDFNWASAKALDRTANAQKLEYGVMGPTAAMAMEVPIPPLLPDAGTDMEERQKAFYFWGEVKYKDAFGQPQTTHFRCAIRGKQWLTNTNMGICHQGNDAT